MTAVRTYAGAASGQMRSRVRTPGKHIVMFLTAAAIVVTAAVNILNPPRRMETNAESARTANASYAGAEIALPEFLVDLAPDRNGRTAYLRLVAVVRAAPEKAAAVSAELERRETAVFERATFLLRGLSADDFDGEERVVRVKAELLRRVNLVIAPARADDLIVTHLVIQ